MVYDISFSRCFCWDMYMYIHFSHTFCWSSLSHSSVPSPSSNLFQLSGWIRADENLNGWKTISHHQVWLTPRKINMESENCWSLQMSLLYNWFIFRFHVNFQGCNQKRCCFPVPLQLFVSHNTYGEKKRQQHFAPGGVEFFCAGFFFNLEISAKVPSALAHVERHAAAKVQSRSKYLRGNAPGEMVSPWRLITAFSQWLIVGLGFRWFGQLTISWSFSFQKKNKIICPL